MGASMGCAFVATRRHWLFAQLRSAGDTANNRPCFLLDHARRVGLRPSTPPHLRWRIKRRRCSANGLIPGASYLQTSDRDQGRQSSWLPAGETPQSDSDCLAPDGPCAVWGEGSIFIILTNSIA